MSTNEVGTSESVSYLGTFTTQGSIPTFTTRQVNLGGTADGDWEASSGCNGGSPTNALRTFTAPNIYKTQLFGMTNCQYAVPDGKPYLVTLKFAEIFYPQTSPGNRRFNVSINGVQVLTNFNVYEAAGNLVDKPVDRTFAITAQRGMIDVQFTSIQDNPIINAVQITPASPSAVRRINIGGPSLTTSDGKVWEADPAGAVACPSVACTTNTAVPEPYRSQRYGNMTLSYSGFPAGAYDVTLKFAETYYGTVGAAGGRRIDATVNGSNFLKSFNPAAAAGAVNTPVDRTFQVFVDTGTIQIVLSSAGDAAIVNAVEIQPSRFWARRINAGMTGLGTHSITDTDAGKFWGPDEYYVGGSSLGDTSTQNPASTQRYFAASGGGYRFPVPPGTYSVRLRFTEIYYPCPASSRAFNVKINGTLVLGNFNPSLANPCTTVERAFLVPVDQSSLIDVKFESVTGDAPIVSAIEVESVSASAYPALSLNISPGTVTGSQGATGTLTLGSPAPGGAVVQLLTSDSSAASVPTSATFQAGATSTTFPIATAGQAVQKVAAITANYEGVLATYPITVNPASASPVITLNPASLTFSSSGSNPPSQSFAITNTGGGTLNWSASGLPSWLSFNPTSGTAPTTVTANVSVAGLSPATYTANVTISNGATSATLPVSLSVNAAGGTLIFREDFEGANPVVGGEYTFVADTPGIRTELYPAGYYSIASNPNDVHDAFCTIADHSEPGTKMMVVNGKGFAAGQTFTTAWERSVPLTQGTNYRFSAWVTSAYYASPAQIQLRADGLNVGAVVIAPSACAPWIQVQGTFQAQGPNATLRILDLNSSGDGNDFALDDIELSVVTAAPTISATPASVALSAIQGASTPVTQAVTLTNSGNLAWTAASNQSWLSVTPTSGSAGASLTISANPTGLAASATPYSGTITVTASGAGNSPLSIPVAFTINAPASPTISLSPASLAFTATQGGNPSPASQTVTVSNSGGGTLTWSAAFVGTAPSWLTLTPSASSLTATVNSTSLAASAVPYTATIAITATGATNTPQNITVSLNVNTSGGISTPLVGWWKFDEAPGTTVLDSSTTSPPSNGTIAGTTYTRVPGKFGSALSLGAASYVDLLNPPALRNFTAPSSVSVSAWVKSTSANGWRSVVAWDSGSGDYYRLNFNAGGSLPARGAAFNVLTAAGNREIIYNVNITDGNWHLLTGTYNGATRVLSIYVDGALGNSTVLPAGEIMQIGGTGDQKVYIGGQKDNSSPPVWEYLDATVDDVRIYNGALTAAEVSTLFTGGGGGSAPAAPTGLTATRGNGQLTLNWAVSSGATSYNVKRATASGGPYTTVATGVTGAPYTNTGLTNGTSYYYVVTAVNSSGESTNSAEASNAPFPPIKDDFESPPPFGFTSGYTYAAPNGTNTLLNEGLFSVYTNPNGLHGAFCSYGDHTSGAGKMMVLNGSSTRTPVWSRNVTGLAVNQTYTLSLWVASAYHLNLAQLQFKVNGTLVTPSITAPSIPAGCPTAIANPWQNLQVTFPATATSATIEIVDLTNATQGDDFAVDDIEVK
ncbi:MAG: malectin domain-containing carbohydrate-binding protein [Bryobacteraceae bacterium]